MQPYLSIITINFNNRAGLETTMQSVLSQTFKDFEYIVIDGGSNDGSKQYIESQEKSIQFWVSEPDNGIYNAMNKGIKAANGEYLLFLNSGDFLNGNTSLKDFINHSDFEGDIIYGDYKFENGFKIFPDSLSPLYFVRTSLPHQSTFFKKEVFEKIGFYDEQYKIVSDRDFFIKCFLSNKFIFKHIEYPLTVFDLKGVSNDKSHQEKHLLECDKMLQNHYGIYYDDYKKMLQLQQELNQVRKKTFFGLMKRVKNKIKKICRIR